MQEWARAQSVWTCLIRALMPLCARACLCACLYAHVCPCASVCVHACVWCHFLLSLVLTQSQVHSPLDICYRRRLTSTVKPQHWLSPHPESAHRSMGNLLRCHTVSKTHSHQFICNHSLYLLTPSLRLSPPWAIYPPLNHPLARCSICSSFVSCRIYLPT